MNKKTKTLIHVMQYVYDGDIVCYYGHILGENGWYYKNCMYKKKGLVLHPNIGPEAYEVLKREDLIFDVYWFDPVPGVSNYSREWGHFLKVIKKGKKYV